MYRTRSIAFRTFFINFMPKSIAFRTRCLHCKEPTLHIHIPRPMTTRTNRCRFSIRRSISITFFTFYITCKFHSMRFSEIRIAQTYHHFVQQVTPARLGTLSTARATIKPTKSESTHRFAQDIFHTRATAHIKVERPVSERISTHPGRCAISTRESRIPIPVICRTFLRVF